LQISRTVIFTVAVLIGLFFIFVVGSVVRTRGARPATGREALAGREGVARSDLDPRGRVFIDGTIWSGRSVGEPVILKGEPVRVVSRDGMVLDVERVTVEEEIGEQAAEPVPSPSIRGLETD
jgi:membrane-bound serine protease (ClpP class)